MYMYWVVKVNGDINQGNTVTCDIFVTCKKEACAVEIYFLNTLIRKLIFYYILEVRNLNTFNKHTIFLINFSGE